MVVPLLTGAALGLSVAAPFGPVSLMCVQNSLHRGLRYGAAAGCGAATAHGIFAAGAIAGAGVVSALLAPWADAIHMLSAVILIGLGIRTMARARAITSPSRTGSLRATYGSLLLLSLSNPMTILPYLALATIVTGAAENQVALSLWSIPGVVLAAAGWYAGISLVAALLRRRVSAGMARLLNLVAGGALIGFGAIIGVHLLG